jgi:hypothetical protein
MYRPAQSQPPRLAGQTFNPRNRGAFAKMAAALRGNPAGRLKPLRAAGARDIRQRAAAFSKAGILASGYFGIILLGIPLCGTAKDDRS